MSSDDIVILVVYGIAMLVIVGCIIGAAIASHYDRIRHENAWAEFRRQNPNGY